MPEEHTESPQGLMCCDESGLCLKKEGDINPLHAGAYTAMIRLASQLEGFESTGTSAVISMETDRSSTIVKQYDGHTVVMKVPAKGGERNISEDDHVQGDQFIGDSPVDDLITEGGAD